MKDTEVETREIKGEKIRTLWRHRCQRETDLSRKKLSRVSNAAKNRIKINLLDLLTMKPLKDFMKTFFVELWSQKPCCFALSA